MDWSTCPFCHLKIASQELQRHANSHFEEDDQLARDMEIARQINDNGFAVETSSGANAPTNDDNRFNSDAGNDIDEKILCLISMQMREVFHKVEDNLMVLLRNCLESEADNSVSLLSGSLDHFHSIESEDVGWGCGWRNIQMLSSHLLMQRQEAKEVLFGGSDFVPDITSLQRWLEIAWERGFDTVGSDHFNHKIYGSRNWIGTTECAALFRSFGLRARIVDFGQKATELQPLSVIHRHNEEGGGEGSIDQGKRKAVEIIGPMDRFIIRRSQDAPQSEPSSHDEFSSIQHGDEPVPTNNSGNNLEDNSLSRKNKGHQVLIDWVWNYFSNNEFSKSGNCSVIVDKAPLYFQHDGHSRTIVGIQAKQQRNGMHQYNLLIFDPAHKTAALEKTLKQKSGWQKLIKRGVHTLKKQQYQLCYVDPGIARGEELEQLKTIDSVLFEF